MIYLYMFFNSILLTVFSANNSIIDKGLWYFFLSVLLCVAIFETAKRIINWFSSLEMIIDKFNSQLSKRNEIIESVRKSYAFEKVKAGVFSIQYFKMLNLNTEMEKEIDGLIKFGVDPEIVNNQKDLTEFLVDLGQGKYDIQVDSVNRKFIFIQKDEDDEED